MASRLERLAGRGFAEASAFRSEVADMALAERNAAVAALSLRPFATVAEYAADLARRTVCLTLLAGSGSRWVKSLAAANAAAPPRDGPGDKPRLDPGRPRGLHPVRDFLRGGRSIPVAGGCIRMPRMKNTGGERRRHMNLCPPGRRTKQGGHLPGAPRVRTNVCRFPCATSHPS